MEHLALEVFDRVGTGSKYAVLEPAASITITATSEIFADGDVWSLSFTLNVYANAHIFGTAGEIHGSRLHEQINKRKARLWVEGLPLYLGYLTLGSEAEVDAKGNVDILFESGQKTFEEMIEGAKANQVPMMSDVRFGVALWRKRKVKTWMHLSASATFTNDEISDSSKIFDDTMAHGHESGTVSFVQDGEDDEQSVQQYPRMVFPKGKFVSLSSANSNSNGYAESNENGNFAGQHLTWQQDGDTINCINTDIPYDNSHPYCNVALCYQKQDYKKTQKDGSTQIDYSGEPEPQRGYEYMPANRVNSAPNFFVIYWLNALMKHLGIYIEENQMMDVEDFRRLFFVNTNCAYKEPKYIRGSNYDTWVNRYRFADGPSSFTIRRLVAERLDDAKELINKEGSHLNAQDYVISGPTLSFDIPQSEIPVIDSIDIKIDEVDELTDTEKNEYQKDNRYLHDAIATSECFPNVDIAEVVSALESGFGVRLLFSDDYKRVRIVLLRNVFRNEEVQDITCEIVDEDVKVENNIRGFRMTYGNTEDTNFYYKGFADMLPHKKELWVDDSDKHDYSHWDLNASYINIIHKVSAFNKTCYVTPITGNAYGIKIDKDAKRYEDYHPSLLEYAGYMDAEDGDCTGEEETIKTINVNFAPAIMNDLNMEAERNGKYDQRFALFVDEEMRVRRPDLEDLPNEEKQPGVKSYDDPDAYYDVDKLYELYGSGGTINMTHNDGVVAPGEFTVTSDMYAKQSGLKTTIRKFIKYVHIGDDDIPVYANWEITRLSVSGNISEGYRLYLQDNYEPNDNGISPIETHDWGLTLGIMRGSGSDAHVNEYDDPDDDENNAWEIVPGSSVTTNPDTCDSYGNEWDYDGSYTITPAEAPAKLRELFPNSDAPFYDAELGYITSTTWFYVRDSSGQQRSVLIATGYSRAGITITNSGDIRYFVQLTLEQLQELSRSSRHMIVEVDSCDERGSTLVQLCKLAYGGGGKPMTIDNGVGSRFGRFSLKLRAEKLNPYYDSTKAESSNNRRYLTITNENLRQRGLADQFYKEYSFWVRNARIVKRTVRMTLAQLLTIDKTKRVRVGDVTGFIRKMQYSVSNETGLGNVVMEIMYI